MFTMMPPGGSAARRSAGEMSVLQHQILTDKNGRMAGCCRERRSE
jgi:hypothetical protein